MNKILLGMAAASAMFFAMSASAALTPSYYGNTLSNGPVIEQPTNSTDAAGYYIWNDVLDPSTWTVAMVGQGASGNVDWFGEIQFQNSELGSTSALTFEGSDTLATYYDVGFLSGIDVVSWDATSLNHTYTDAFSFTLDSSMEVLEFNLGSSMFNAPNASDVAGTGIFMGDGMDTPNVSIHNANGKTYQQFEVAVPEPSILALFGLGLIGMGFASRKKQA